MCKVKGSDSISFIGEILNWNDGEKICNSFKDGGQFIMEIMNICHYYYYVTFCIFHNGESRKQST